MKKLLIAFALVLVLMLGAAVWFVMRAVGSNDAPSLVPDQTIALISFPNFAQSALRWPNTALAKIGVEPEVKAFLDKPLSYLSHNGSATDAGDVLFKLKPSRIFVAVTAVSANEGSVLVGFQFWGGKAAHDDAIKRLRHQLAAGGAESEIMREPYENTEITGSIHNGTTLYSVNVGNWGFLSNSLPLLKDTVDRAAGRKTTGSLSDSERYKKTVGHLVKDPDFLLFVQPQSLLDTLLTVGQGMGAQQVPSQIEQMRKIEAFGAGIKLDGLDLHDSAFILYPNPPEAGTLTHAGSQFTDKNTIAYFDMLVDFQQIADSSKNPTFAALMSSPAMQATHLPDLLPQAFGPEIAVTSSWTAQSLRPTAIAALQVKDPAKAEESLQALMALYPDTAVSEQNGTKLYSFPALKGLFTNPTLALKDKFLFLGLDGSDLQQALAGPSKETMETSPDFTLALPSYRKPGQVFGYVDTKAIFERGYPQIRQIVMFSAAFMPGAADVIDATKLPQTDTIARHLNPILYSQTRLPDGYLMESSGPITLNQAIILGALGGSYFAPKH